MRFEMEMERMKQMHQKELEDKEEELEDVHKSSQRRVRPCLIAAAAHKEGRIRYTPSGIYAGLPRIVSGPNPPHC